MHLRVIKVGCFGGGTGLPSVLGGLKRNPWLDLHAIVTMFDSGGSSGQLRDELGVLPPGDVLKCALALARNEREARRLLLSRLPTLEDSRLAGHTGGNLLLSMMEQYSGNFLAASRRPAGAARAAADASGRSASSRRACARATPTGRTARGEVDVDTQLDRRPRDRGGVARSARADSPRRGGRDRRTRRRDHRARQFLSRASCPFSP